MIDIKYFGFGTPPHGTIDMLTSMNFNRPLTFYIIDPLTGSSLPYDEISQLDTSTVFVIVQTGEGHGHREFDILLHQLELAGVPADHITIYSGCLYDPASPVNNIGTIVPHVGVTLDLTGGNYASIEPTHHYVCLNRMPRWERYEIVKTLLDRRLDKFGKISYASAFTPGEFAANFDTASYKPTSHVTDEYRHLFPMYIDHVVGFDQGYKIIPAVAGAMFNVVTESAYETVTTDIIGQSLPTLTEKTFKCFIAGQIPILVSAQYTVRAAREFGFDMFDDVVDHDSYDACSDPAKRIDRIADQIERICKLTLTELVELKQQLQPRLEQNFARLKYLAYNNDFDRPRWQQYFEQVGMV